MSALPLKADISSAPFDVRFGPKADSCIACKHAELFNELVGNSKQRRRYFEAQLLGSLSVDDQLELG